MIGSLRTREDYKYPLIDHISIRVANNKTAPQIAKEIGISEKEIKRHIRYFMRKYAWKEK